ncbi:MAG: hypothetical protein EXR92_02670 [Gemmatimonadetes bacterium]|nr:hypothetical protein [Gemmatimonadota bacterium]
MRGWGTTLMGALAALVGFLIRQRPWRWAILLLTGQFGVVLATNPAAVLMPFGVVLVGTLGIPLVMVAYLGVLMRPHLRPGPVAPDGS